jgi:glycosyltransferase involved in cell wall biosynthesis
MYPKLSVVIPVYNGERTIEQCLESVISAKPANKEIIVVDNNSTDKTREIVETFSDVRLLIEKTKGPGAARNRGLRAVRSEIVILVDSDVFVKKETFVELVKFLDNDSVAGVGGIPESYDKNNLISLSQDVRLFGNSIFDKNVKNVSRVPTMIIAYKTKILKEVEFFNEDYFPSGEDVDMNYRIQKKNYKLLINGSSRVFHNHPLSLKNLAKKWFDYGIGCAKLSRGHAKYFDVVASFLWLASVFIFLVLAFVRIEFLGFLFVIFALPWVVYYALPTLRYLIKKRYPRALIFPFIHQVQILSRSLGVVYGTLTLRR